MLYVAAVLQALFLSLLLSIPAQAGYKVTLQNGQVLEADTFTVENSKITLKYKVGEVSFPMSMVQSVTDDYGQGNFLSGPAPQVVKPAEPQAPPRAPQAAQPQQPLQPVQPGMKQAAPSVPPPPQAGLPGVAGDDELDQEDDSNDDSDELPPNEGEQ